jgi:hypothetical protein
MKKDCFEISIAPAIGDTVYLRTQLDQLIPEYNEIKVSYYKPFIEHYRGVNVEEYYNFINEYGKLFFSEPPYNFTRDQYRIIVLEDLYFSSHLFPIRRDFSSILCSPTYKNELTDYIVVNTKFRLFKKSEYLKFKNRFFDALRLAAKKYKIVVLGEQKIEFNNEYATYGAELTYTMYDDILANIAKDRIVDLSVPGCGLTVPSLEKIRNDRCILRDAKFVVTIGFGGHFCLSSVTAGKHIALDQQHVGIIEVEQYVINQKNDKFLATNNVDEFIRHIIKESY